MVVRDRPAKPTPSPDSPRMSTLSDHDHEANLRKQILELTRELQRHRQQTRKPFEPGVDYLGYAGRVYDEQEVVAAVDTVLDFWLTLGPEGAAFEKELAKLLGVRWSLLTNSGSSALSLIHI